MLNISIPFKQEVVHENEQIYQRIATEIKKARKQILVVTAWFTDQTLFDILYDQAANGVDVRVIIVDNEDNKKLNFTRLQNRGAKVHKVKSSGYGGLRTRFCVVDGQTAIHGSYNWSIAAREKNQESVIVTDHPETVNDLIKRFYEMEREAGGAVPEKEKWTIRSWFKPFWRKQRDNDATAPAETTDGAEVPATVQPQEPSDENDDSVYINTRLWFEKEYAGVLDKMIAAELGSFDRELLKNQGYELAKANNGDPQVLHSALDGVYAVFINDMNIVDDKKKRLIGKIQEQKIIHTNILEKKYLTGVSTIEADMEQTRQKIGANVAMLKTRAEVYELDITTIKTEKIASADKTTKEIEDEIKEMALNSVRPRFKWHEFIPVVGLFIGLLSYLVLFYSSAIYILLYSEEDAVMARTAGTLDVMSPPEVFEPRAFSRLLEKDGHIYAMCFIALFVFLPIALSMLNRIAKGTFLSREWVMYPLALLLDGFIAYKVAHAIYEVRILTGDADAPWHFHMAFTDLNFYLVFVLGSLGLFIFHTLFCKLISLFEERSPDVHADRLKLRKEQVQEKLNKHSSYVSALHENAGTLHKELVKVKTEIHLAESELAGIPHQKTMQLGNHLNEFENNKKMLYDISELYILNIENNIFPVSLDMVRDRAGVFLDGWHRYLNNEYAAAKASEKTKLAIDAAAAWEAQKLAGSRIDNRIKLIL